MNSFGNVLLLLEHSYFCVSVIPFPAPPRKCGESHTPFRTCLLWGFDLTTKGYSLTLCYYSKVPLLQQGVQELQIDP